MPAANPLLPTPKARATAEADNFAAAARNPTLRPRVNALLTRMVDLYEWIMDNGTREEQTQLMKSALPGIIKGVEQAEAEEKQAQMAASYQRLRELFAAKIKNPVVVPVVDGEEE